MASISRKDIDGYLPQKAFRKSQNSVSPFPMNSFNEPSEVKSASENVPISIRKRSRWQILRHRRNRVGVVPVDNDHVHHTLLSCIREGLRRVALERPDLVAKSVLKTEDFNEVTTTSGSVDGQEFEFESYAESVFATLRQSVGIDEQEYLTTVALSDQPYLEFKSNSKSGQDFFFSHNMQFIFKSNRKRDVTFFQSILPKYLQHLISYPHSLLVKYVGCHMIRMKGKRRKYFLAMQSIFHPADRIEDRFDIKGCTAGRYQEPEDPNSHVITVLKDQNFLNEELDFGDEGDWFLSQVTVDSKFLCELKCMDYSLLIGRQKKHADERITETIFTVVNRAGKSISPTKKNIKLATTIDNQHYIPDRACKENQFNNSNGIPDTQTSGSKLCSTSSLNHDIYNKMASSKTIIVPTVKPGIMFPRSLADGVEKFQEEHRRLLPKCQNELHIIDGKECRYFLGIVDFLTLFDWRQKTAQYWKMVKYACGDHSTKRPDVYQQRFVLFLRDRVK